MLNHIPVIGLAVPIALLVIEWLRKSRQLEWLCLQMFVAFAVLSIPVYLTGSPAHHQMREMPGISENTIQRHCNVADFAFWTMEGLGALSLFALYKYRSSAKVPARLSTATLILALITLGLMSWTANLGGKIRHSEISVTRGEIPLELASMGMSTRVDAVARLGIDRGMPAKAIGALVNIRVTSRCDIIGPYSGCMRHNILKDF
jgi:hypothetical protein